MDKVKVKGYIGIGLLVIMFLSFFLWEMYGRNVLMYENVVALNNAKNKGEIIKEEDITFINIEKNSIGSAIEDSKEIIGKATLVDIPSSIPVTSTYFDEANNTPLKDQFIFEIPSAWIYGIPQSIRAKDTAYLYEVKQGEEASKLVIEENNIEAVESEKKYEYVLTANIKYVKDGSNREVTNVGNNRNDGTSKATSIEIIGTIEDLNNLEIKASKGSKFIVLYKE